MMNVKMNMLKIVTITLCGLSLMMLTCSPGYAQDRWEFLLIPYLGMSGVNGDVAVKGLESSADASFSDILDVLDFAFQLHGEARKGRWALMLDPTYLKLSEDANAGPADVKIQIQQWVVDFAGFYRPYERALSGERVLALEVLLGGRYTSLDQELEIVGLGKGRETKQWFDPIVGGRLMTDLTKKLVFTLRGDIGGFGISSDLTWNVSAVLGYRFTKLFSLWGGYKALGTDYTTGSGSDLFKYDTVTQGPVFGLGFSF